jgi:hypothetical protein
MKYFKNGFLATLGVITALVLFIAVCSMPKIIRYVRNCDTFKSEFVVTNVRPNLYSFRYKDKTYQFTRSVTTGEPKLHRVDGVSYITKKDAKKIIKDREHFEECLNNDSKN